MYYQKSDCGEGEGGHGSQRAQEKSWRHLTSVKDFKFNKQKKLDEKVISMSPSQPYLQVHRNLRSQYHGPKQWIFSGLRNSILNSLQVTKHLKHFSMCSQNSFYCFRYPKRGQRLVLTNNKQVQVDCVSNSSIQVTYSCWPAKFNGHGRVIVADAILVPSAHLDNTNRSILTWKNFFHSYQMPLTVWK